MPWYVTRSFQLSIAQLVEWWTVDGFFIGQLVSMGRCLNSFSDEFVGFIMFLFEHFSIPVSPLAENLGQLLELGCIPPCQSDSLLRVQCQHFFVQPLLLVNRHLTWGPERQTKKIPKISSFINTLIEKKTKNTKLVFISSLASSLINFLIKRLQMSFRAIDAEFTPITDEPAWKSLNIEFSMK